MVLRKRPGARKGGWSNEKRGRRPLLNPEVAFAIAHSLQCGMTRRDSATLSRVNRSTFFAWMKRARAEQQAGIVSQFTELLDLVQKAEAEAVFEALVRIRKGDDGWESAAWWLARRYPREWGRPWKQPAAPEVKFEWLPTSGARRG